MKQDPQARRLTREHFQQGLWECKSCESCNADDDVTCWNCEQPREGRMRAYSSMPIEEFVAQLRDIAIGAKARPAVIDALDSIDTSDKDAEIDKIDAELTAMEENRNDLAGALRDIETILLDRELDGPTIKEALKRIEDALSRSG